MAIRAFTGFESGGSFEASAAIGTFSVQTANVRSGTYSLRVNPSGSSTGYFIASGMSAGGAPAANALSLPTSYSTVYFLYHTKPASGSEQILTVNDTTNALKFELRLNSSGNLAAYDSTGTNLLATGATVLSADTYYRIGVSCATGASAAWEVRINGVSEISGSTANLGSGNAGQWRLGRSVNRNSQSIDFYYDDWVVDDAGFSGAQQTTILVPRASGTFQTATIGAGGGVLNYQAVDEVPPDDNTSYLVSDGTTGDAETELFTSTGTAGINGVVNGVILINKGARDGSINNGNLKARLRSGTTNLDATGQAFFSSTTYIGFGVFSSTDPATGSGWTLAGVDAIEGGFVENSANKSRVTASYVMVNWVPVSGPVDTSRSPASGTLTITGNNAAFPSQPISPAAATITITGSAPTLNAPVPLKPNAASLALAGNAGSLASQGASGVAKPPATWVINQANPLGDVKFLVLYNEGPGATQLTDYVSGTKSISDPNMSWTTLGSELPVSGPAVNNLTGVRANARFDQSGACLADALFQNSTATPYTGGYTVAWIAKPTYDGTAGGAVAYVCDNSGQTSPGNPANFNSYLNSVGNPGMVGETVKNSSSQTISAALTEFSFNHVSIPWIFCVKVMGSGTGGGIKVYANLDANGNAFNGLRLVATQSTADCHGTLGPAPIGGMNALGVWGTLGLAGSPAQYGYYGIWNRPLSVSVDGSNKVNGGDVFSLFNNPVQMMQSPGGTSDTQLAPGPANLTLTGNQPFVKDINRIPFPGSVALTGFAPGTGSDRTATPTVASLALTGSAPTPVATVVGGVISSAPLPTSIIKLADPLGDVQICVPTLTGRGTHLRDFVTHNVSGDQASLTWATLPVGLPWTGGYINNAAGLAVAAFDNHPGECFSGAWGGGLTVAAIFQPIDGSTAAFIGDTKSQTAGGFCFLINPSGGTPPNIGQGLKTSANADVVAAKTGYAYASGTTPWICAVTVIQGGVAGGAAQWANLNSSGLRTTTMTKKTTLATVDCAKSVGSAATTGLNILGSYASGVPLASDGKVNLLFYGVWARAFTDQQVQDLHDNPWKMLKGPDPVIRIA